MTSNDGNSKEEEVGASVPPTHDANKDSDHAEEGSSITNSANKLDGLANIVPAAESKEQGSTSKPANGRWSDTPINKKSITGSNIPEFLSLQPNEVRIAESTSAEDVPTGWYRFDNGCRSGKKKIPQRDIEYERQLSNHAKWTSDNQEVQTAHRVKAKLEKDAYDRCFLVYRAHLARTLKSGEWNKDNIKEHPAYESEWPWALLPHPSEDWNAGYHEPSRNCPTCEDYSR